MSGEARATIVDFGGGNLYNVRRACAHVGLTAHITEDVAEIAAADALILPGIGSMKQAMDRLSARGLVAAIRSAVDRGAPLLGVCLGLQLLMSRGTEFGEYEGLGILEGTVTRFPATDVSGRLLRVPHIGWAQVSPAVGRSWEGSLLEAVRPGSAMYFVHSYRIEPADPGVIVATTEYGGYEFPAAIQVGNVFAAQFHPERSGEAGLKVYRSFAARVRGGAAVVGGA